MKGGERREVSEETEEEERGEKAERTWRREPSRSKPSASLPRRGTRVREVLRVPSRGGYLRTRGKKRGEEGEWKSEKTRGGGHVPAEIESSTPEVTRAVTELPW